MEFLLAHRRTGFFWLDTLCIPVAADLRASEIETVKQTAINSIGLIYASAAPTVVLDAELRRLRGDSHPVTLLAYASFCGWTTCAWTLQEGSLPKAIVFALSDGYFYPTRFQVYRVGKKRNVAFRGDVPFPGDPESTDDRRDEEASTLETHLQLRKIISSYWTETQRPIWTNVDVDRVFWEEETVKLVWNLLNRQHTTEERDLPLILGNLLGFPATDTLRSNRPLATIIGSLGYVPVGILYNSGPRLGSISNSSGSMSEPGPRLSNSTYRDFDFLNRWVPTQIRGAIIPDGPVFVAFGSTLRLHYRPSTDSSAPKPEILTTHMIVTMPPKFVMKHALYPAQVFVVTVHTQPGDDVANERLTTFTKGFCFITEANLQNGQSAKRVVSGAALAIVQGSSNKLTTIFHSAVCVEADNVQGGTAASEDLPVVQQVVMLYIKCLWQALLPSQPVYRPTRSWQSIEDVPGNYVRTYHW